MPGQYLLVPKLIIKIMTNFNFNLNNLTTLLREIGLYSLENKPYKAKQRKQQQILAYLPHIQSALNKLSSKRPAVLLDCGCGKSYLSFVIYAYCASLKRDVKIIGIDRNQDLINQCNQSAKILGFSNMHFYCGDAADFKPEENIDITYSLHACDMATDYTIATGMKFGARYIFSVSCCQHSSRAKISNHPLSAASRFMPYKERLVDMIGDSMRALLLENEGYGVNIFEFINSQYTPKNVMLRAIKGNAKKSDRETAMQKYRELTSLFNFAPKLEELI